MWRALRVGSDRTTGVRLGVSGALALVVHAGAALSLPRLPPSSAQREQVAPTPAPVWMQLGGEHRGAPAASGQGDGEAGTPAAPPSPPVEPPAAPRRTADPVRRAVARPRAVAPEPASQPSPEPELAAADPAVAAQVGADGVGAGSSQAGEMAGAAGPGSTPGAGPGGGGTPGTPVAARLLARGDPCAGYFPVDAPAAHGRVRLTVEIDARGVVRASEVLGSVPAGAGFEQAARACAARLRFAPASSARGEAVASRTQLVLRFDRP